MQRGGDVDADEEKKSSGCTHYIVCNEVVDFNASANDCAPISPIWLPVRLKEEAARCRDVDEKKRSSTHCSACNEVFDFSASANDCAPLSPIWLLLRLKEETESVGMTRKEEVLHLL